MPLINANKNGQQLLSQITIKKVVVPVDIPKINTMAINQYTEYDVCYATIQGDHFQKDPVQHIIE